MKTANKRNAGGHIRSTIGFEMLVQDVMTGNVISVRKYESIMSVAKILSGVDLLD